MLAAAAHEAPFRRALRGLIPARNLIVEPMARGTAVAIAYGAATIKRRLGDGVIASVAADHYIATGAAISRARSPTRSASPLTSESIVAIGIPPTRPETGYGYQKIGAKVGAGFRIEKFVEKPPLAIARRMVRSGRYLWNASMFVASTQTLAREFAAHSPALASRRKNSRATPRTKLARAYGRLRYDSFDRVIMEKSARVLSVRARFSWHDVGSWDGLWDAVGGADGNVIRGHAIALDSERVLAHSDSRLMVLFGVRDLIVVDTGDAILMAHRDKSDAIRRVTDALATPALRKYL